MGQFYVDNLRTLSICQQLAKKLICRHNSSIDRRPVNNSPSFLTLCTTLSEKYTHITPIQQSLHWLKVRDCIIFKILLLVFHCIKGFAPHYNIDFVHKYTPVRSLRSSNSGSLVVPKSAKTLGERGFAQAGPALWNNLVIKNCMSPDSCKKQSKNSPE